MAPEVFYDGAVLKSDVWSLGISIIEMTNDSHPYQSMSSARVMMSILNNPPPEILTAGWSIELVDFVKKCLMKNVNERASVEELMKVNALASHDL